MIDDQSLIPHEKVPKGTKSILGHEMAEETRFSFSTPTLSVVRQIVTEGPTSKLIFVQFDQRIDPEAIFSLTKISPAAPRRLATAADDAFFEAEQKHFSGKGLPTFFSALQTSRSNAPEGRWICFHLQDLRPATDFALEMGPGLVSLLFSIFSIFSSRSFLFLFLFHDSDPC